jgi:hypothetical protein
MLAKCYFTCNCLTTPVICPERPEFNIVSCLTHKLVGTIMSKKNRDKDQRNERNAAQKFNQQQHSDSKWPGMMNKFEQQRPEINMG